MHKRNTIEDNMRTQVASDCIYLFLTKLFQGVGVHKSALLAL